MASRPPAAAAALVRGLTGAVALPGRIVSLAVSPIVRLDGALRNIEDLASGVRDMHSEMVALRGDVQILGSGVENLRGDVRAMDHGVDGIRLATESLDGRLVEVLTTMGSVDERLGGLSGSLEAVDLLAARLGRLTGRRGRDRARAPAPVAAPDDVPVLEDGTDNGV